MSASLLRASLEKSSETGRFWLQSARLFTVNCCRFIAVTRPTGVARLIEDERAQLCLRLFVDDG
jgi:hypothetical protein